MEVEEHGWYHCPECKFDLCRNCGKARAIKGAVGDTFCGLSGLIWCILAGFCYGALNVFAKLAYEKGFQVSRFILVRHFVLFFASFTIGKFIRGIDFDLRKQDPQVIKLLIFRSFLNLVSKSCQFAAIALMPLALSSTISFTTGPIFAALLAYIIIRERLTIVEMGVIAFGILGTAMITMPQWFMFLGVEKEAIGARYAEDMGKYKYYGLALILALSSSFLDVATVYIIRHLGTELPSAIIPFLSGLTALVVVGAYCIIFEPFQKPTYYWLILYPSYPTALLYAFIGSFFGYLAIEFMIIGCRITKSALATNAEQCGILLPFAFDVFYLGRQFLLTDGLGLTLVVVLQSFLAYRSTIKAQEKEGSDDYKEGAEMMEVEMEECEGGEDSEWNKL